MPFIEQCDSLDLPTRSAACQVTVSVTRLSRHVGSKVLRRPADRSEVTERVSHWTEEDMAESPIVCRKATVLLKGMPDTYKWTAEGAASSSITQLYSVLHPYLINRR